VLRCATSISGRRAGLQDRYNAPVVSRNRLGALIGAGAVLLLALAGGGCSLSLQLASLQNDPETTASVPISPLSPTLDTEDWRRAQAAVSLAVDPQGSGQVVNWENPATKRKGSFVPTGNLVLAENTVCRPFSATIVDGGAKSVETRHLGKACRTGPGEWVIREVKEQGGAAGLPLTTASTGPLKLDAGAVKRDSLQPLPAATSAMLPRKSADPTGDE
jgi:surface antigen